MLNEAYWPTRTGQIKQEDLDQPIAKAQILGEKKRNFFNVAKGGLARENAKWPFQWRLSTVWNSKVRVVHPVARAWKPEAM